MCFPGFENVFSLGEPFATRPFRGSLSEKVREIDCLSLALGRLVPSRPIRIVPYGGRKPGDFIWTDWAGVGLVSHRVLTLFRDSQILGWSTSPVEVSDRAGRPMEGFSGFSVTGRSGHIDPAFSTPIMKQMPGGQSPYYRGRFYDHSSWDGSNAFSPEDTTHIFITRSVYELLQRAKATNVEYCPILQMEFNECEKGVLEGKLAKG